VIVLILKHMQIIYIWITSRQSIRKNIARLNY